MKRDVSIIVLVFENQEGLNRFLKAISE